MFPVSKKTNQRLKLLFCIGFYAIFYLFELFLEKFEDDVCGGGHNTQNAATAVIHIHRLSELHNSTKCNNQDIRRL